MIGTYRFVKEYANFQKKSISENEQMKSDLKDKALFTIDKALSLAERNMITVNEAMQILNNPFFCWIMSSQNGYREYKTIAVL